MKYDFELNVQLENNSHSQLINRVPEHSRVLEIGCATGYMSRYLTEQKNCQVIGVEMDSLAAKKAENFCERVICANVENEEWFTTLSEQPFDVILCADILEHLRDPVCFLKKIVPFVEPNKGILIASVPNGAHISLRLELLAGHFTYEDTGLLDRTHLHLFTHSSIRSLFARAGYQVQELSYTFHDIPDPVIQSRLARLGLSADDVFYQHIHQPEAAAYQYIIAAKPSPQIDNMVDKELTDKPMRESWDFYYNFRDAYAKLEQEKQLLETQNQQLSLIYNGLPYRLSRKIKRYLKTPVALLKKIKKTPKVVEKVHPPSYQDWIREKEPLSLSEQRKMKEYRSDLTDKPLISIVIPVYNAKADYLIEAIESILQQSYPKWQLCIADDASTEPHIHTILKDMEARDKRIEVVFRTQNEQLVVATHSALSLAQGDFIGLMNQNDRLAPDALYFVAKNISEHTHARLFYADEDKIDGQGNRFGHYFKPDYNPDLMLSHHMMGRFGIYQRQLLEKIGGMREKYQGVQNYDLALRFIQQLESSQIIHIPHILYHQRAIENSPIPPLENSIAVVSEHLQTLGYKENQFHLSESPFIQNKLRVQYHLPENPPLVSLIIPTKNAVELLKQCIDSIQNKTIYPKMEILVVDNQSDEPPSLDYLQDLEKKGIIRMIQYNHPFNYSAINNVAVKQAKGAILAFLNNDIEAIEEGWLTEMVSHALRPQIGAVGARLWYPNNLLQHGGVILGLGGVAGHAMKHLPKNETGYNDRAVLVQNYSAVTAACLVMKKSIFEEVGGFNETDLKIAFNDVDLCLRIGECGYKIVWTPHANLYHHESATRGEEDTPEKQQRFNTEINYMMSRWSAKLAHDPAYNQNLTHSREDFSLNW